MIQYRGVLQLFHAGDWRGRSRRPPPTSRSPPSPPAAVLDLEPLLLVHCRGNSGGALRARGCIGMRSWGGWEGARHPPMATAGPSPLQAAAVREVSTKKRSDTERVKPQCPSLHQLVAAGAARPAPPLLDPHAHLSIPFPSEEKFFAGTKPQERARAPNGCMRKQRWIACISNRK